MNSLHQYQLALKTWPIKTGCLLVIWLLVYNNIHAQTNFKSDSIRVSIAPAYNNVTGLHKRLFGNGYRSSWATPVNLRVCYLSAEKGGLTIIRRGGGLQTKSLRLIDASGKEWVLRTIQKYPEQGLPPYLRNGLVQDILQDQVITAHPFASLTVAPLADAIGIPHANPEIVYLAADTALHEYAGDFANAVYLLEEREPTGAYDTDNTEKVQDALEENHDVSIDQRVVLRARLLDMIMGDWDRHEDQWRWQREEGKKNRIYTPVPRDRDMVYYNTTGIFPWIVSHQWLKSKFQGFHENIRDIKGFNINARYFDRYFLNELDETAWKEEINFVQSQLTDSLISTAIHRLPDTIFHLTGPLIIRNLIARRNNISKVALDYYRFISSVVSIPASDKKESFFIGTNADSSCTITIKKINKNGLVGETVYQRNFYPAITREVRLYGLAGDDVFTTDSNFTTPIRIRMIGGAGTDSFYVYPTVKHKRNLYIYDRKDELNTVPPKSLAKLRLANDSAVNSFDRKSFRYDRFAIVTVANYSLDEGIILRTGFFNEEQGFRKDPYASRHEFLVNYSLGRKAFLLSYTAVIKKMFRNNDLLVDVYSRGPQNLSNFFGTGNEPIFINKGDKKIGYYRSRYDYVNAAVRISHQLSPHMRLSGGPALQYYTSSQANNGGRFFDTYNNQYPSEKLYEHKMYAGLVAGLELDTRNSQQFATQGVYFNTTIKGLQQLNSDKKTSATIVSEYSFYKSLDKKDNFVIANRTGAGAIVGDPSFFQLLYLGGTQTMRGFHTNRFCGKAMLYNNLELRNTLFRFNAYVLPGTVGLVLFNDFGRVWMPGETSGQWHDSYGGGIYIEPAQLLLLQGVIGFSKEGRLPYITVGVRF